MTKGLMKIGLWKYVHSIFAESILKNGDFGELYKHAGTNKNMYVVDVSNN